MEGTHEAIIQKHDFDLVQRLRRIDTRTSPKSDKVYLFSGILICGCCGCRMTRKTNRYKDKEYHYYYCPTGKGNGCTSSVMLKESDLIECVQDSLKGHIENVASLDALLSSISQERINRELAQEYAAQIRVNEKRVAQTEGFKAKLYENLVSGIIDERKNFSLISENTMQILNCSKRQSLNGTINLQMYWKTEANETVGSTIL